ncbi:helix-turn-helix domain-containing protein [Nocardia cyriacigeorgica]|uniref:helix-turn-helix domain-containing protein n=1 Tax=Nocardia cyriacigeorgica TaxID=135487 RepID=UPI002456AD1C|nr:helix-turn-helix transcriptional regulator [Nocardia cyriacigeorgica]
MKETNSTLPRRELGRQLREAREGMGMSLEQAAELVDLSPSSLQRLETGQNSRVSVVVVRELCDAYGLDQRLTAALIGLAQETAGEQWLQEYGDPIPSNFSVFVRVEAAAKTLFTYEPNLVPGLLQTPAYARALVRAAFPDDPIDEQERMVGRKVRRQALVTRRRNPLELNVVIGEAALRAVVGGPKIMAAQLKHIADLSTRPNITVRVVPFSAGAPLGQQIGPFVILEFGTNRRGHTVEPTTVYAENYSGALYSAKVRMIDRYRRAFSSLQELALSEIDTRTLLRRIAKELT